MEETATQPKELSNSWLPRQDKWPPNSPDLSRHDFAVFGWLKGALSGVQYHTQQLK